MGRDCLTVVELGISVSISCRKGNGNRIHLNIIPVNQISDLLMDCKIGASAEPVGRKPAPHLITLSPSLENPSHTMVQQLFEKSAIKLHFSDR